MACSPAKLIVNESLPDVSNDNGVRVVNFATSKDLTVKSTMFLNHNIHPISRWENPHSGRPYSDGQEKAFKYT
jgi:hypothetical protein